MLGQGMEQILLEVRPSNHRALALYRRLGFAQIGIRKVLLNRMMVKKSCLHISVQSQ